MASNTMASKRARIDEDKTPASGEIDYRVVFSAAQVPAGRAGFGIGEEDVAIEFGGLRKQGVIIAVREHCGQQQYYCRNDSSQNACPCEIFVFIEIWPLKV